MLPFVEHWTTSREEFLEFSLVEMNDQVFKSNGLRMLTFVLRHCLLVALEANFPGGFAILFSIEN